MFPKNHSTASINLFLVTFLIVALDIGEFLIKTFLAHAHKTKFGLGYGSFLCLSFLFFFEQNIQLDLLFYIQYFIS